MTNGMKRIANGLCALACVLAAANAAAQAYPVKPVKIVVPFGAGGIADITARVLALKMSETMGQQVIVENRPSAGGIVAAEAVAKSDPDGYTLLLMSNGTAVSAGLFKTLPYDTIKDFAPVSTAGFFDLVLLANGDAPFATVKDLVAFAKANPNKLNIGSINIGSTQHLAAELFKSMAAIDAQVVPFKGTPAVITALRGGEIQVAIEILGPAMAQIKAGSLKALGIASTRRFAGLPNVPTIAESGVPGYQASSWNGIAVPAKTPRAIVERLQKEISVAVAAPEVWQRLQDLGVEARSSTPEALRDLLASEIAKWGAVIEKAKLEKQ